MTSLYCKNDSMYESLAELFGEQLVISFECCYKTCTTSKDILRSSASSPSIQENLKSCRNEGYISIHQQLRTHKLRPISKQKVNTEFIPFVFKVHQIPKYSDNSATMFRSNSNAKYYNMTGKKNYTTHFKYICYKYYNVSSVWL